MGRSNWTNIEIGAGECKVPRLFGPRARGNLQRFIGDFVSENLFFRLVEAVGGGGAQQRLGMPQLLLIYRSR